ncbi:helix-turn-helix transcriptional regulator [bacterium]|nr:helix-turn-helix transcriptional regulator [bacterium]
MSSGHSVESPSCKALGEVLARIGDKWTIFVVRALTERPLRFNELKRRVDGISQRMLTRTLRSLERDGFVTRTVHPSVPPSVEYALTESGYSLRCPLDQLAIWATEHMPGILAAREAFDADNHYGSDEDCSGDE